MTRLAVYYVGRCLLDEDAPTNDGCLRPITLTLPEGSVVNARPPRAVSAGNVETSQRIVAVVLGALVQAAGRAMRVQMQAAGLAAVPAAARGVPVEVGLDQELDQGVKARVQAQAPTAAAAREAAAPAAAIPRSSARSFSARG